MHIAVAGNIGSGKTTLTGLLAKHFNWKPHYEEVEHNPYLDSFYEDMQPSMRMPISLRPTFIRWA